MAHVRHSCISILLTTLVWLLSPVAAAAQTTLYVLVDGDGKVDCGSPCQRQPALWEIDVEHAVIRSQTSLPSTILTGPGLAATADGRYLVWLGTDAAASPSAQTLNLFDRLTRTSTEILRQPMPTSGIGAWLPVLAHPTRLRVFTQLIGQLPFAIDAGGVTPLNPGVAPQVVMENLTASGNAVMLKRIGGAALMNSGTGAVIKHMDVAQDTWAVNREGTELYSAKTVAPPFGTTSEITIRRYDAATGAILTERVETTGGDGVRSLRLDPRTGRVFADMLSGVHKVLAADSLESLGQVASAFLPSGATGRLAFDTHRARAYLLSTRWLPGNTYENSIDVLDSDSLATIGGGRLPTALAASAIVVVPRPPAPASLTATVDGARVTLQWIPGAGAGLPTGYQLEAGSETGSNNLASVDLGLSLELVVNDVPSRTYHVRVRATNFAGASDPSNEVTITVP